MSGVNYATFLIVTYVALSLVNISATGGNAHNKLGGSVFIEDEDPGSGETEYQTTITIIETASGSASTVTLQTTEMTSSVATPSTESVYATSEEDMTSLMETTYGDDITNVTSQTSKATGNETTTQESSTTNVNSTTDVSSTASSTTSSSTTWSSSDQNTTASDNDDIDLTTLASKINSTEGSTEDDGGGSLTSTEIWLVVIVGIMLAIATVVLTIYYIQRYRNWKVVNSYRYLGEDSHSILDHTNPVFQDEEYD